MRAFLVIVGLVVIALILWDGFEAMLLPRRVSRSVRFARLFYVYSWRPWSALARRLPPGKPRNSFLSVFGPLSIIVLFAVWALGLIFGFALVQWALRSPLRTPEALTGPGTYLYYSGVTFFTLGYGDVTPIDPVGRTLAVAEAGVGFAFLAVVIGYLPVLYQAFSRREVTISLLDARAGSPPTAAQLLERLARGRDVALLDRFLDEWERWAAEVLESHLSFPLLSFYRSQHDNQSWLAALTVILDTTALVIAGVEGINPYRAQLAFAMARHAVVDLSQVFRVPPVGPEEDRLPEDRLRRLRDDLRLSGLSLRDGEAVDQTLANLRGMYEPFVAALSRQFLLNLPPVVPEAAPVDNWQTSAWMRRTCGISGLVPAQPGDDHLD